eukprot:CAMPEP_0113634018 /NCGR_PEP_ID=MMETSP0017_2-20120614/17711_1 /TAXON_ID=2856 /ORGANISM="Cylindrotheca closterium" /LENGTH=33 /DNA_ID=CAMNT_0000544695 /DNA_START=350 /DNA_END=451 /DNA_ORIENTATION=+ /assembly_acc=CAM_ASM_000147
MAAPNPTMKRAQSKVENGPTSKSIPAELSSVEL